MADSPPKGATSRLRRVLTITLRVGILLCVVLAGIRLYLSDDRLKELLEDQGSKLLGQTVHIEELHFSFLDGLRLYKFSLGTAKTDALALEADQLTIDWNWADQSWTRLALEHLNIQGLTLYQGLHKTLPTKPKEAAPQTQAAPKLILPRIPLQEWPLVFSIKTIHLELKALHLKRDTTELNLRGLLLEGSLALGSGLANTQLTLQTVAQYAHIEISDPSLLAIKGTPKLLIELSTENESQIKVATSLNVPTQSQTLSLQNEVLLDTVKGQLDIQAFEATIDQHSYLKTNATLENIYTEPRLQIGQLDLQSDFDALKPLLEFLDLPVEFVGKAWLHLEPLRLTSLNRTSLDAATVQATLEAKDLSVVAGANHINKINGTLEIKHLAGLVTAESETLSLGFFNPDLNLTSSQFKFSLKTHIGDWLQQAATQNTSIDLKANIPTITLAGTVFRHLDFHLITDGPTAILRKQSKSAPLTYSLELRSRALEQAKATLGSLTLNMQGKLHALSAQSFESNLVFTSSSLTLRASENPIEVKNLVADISLKKQGTFLQFEKSTLTLPKVLDVEVTGKVLSYTNESALFQDLNIKSAIEDLHALKAWAPPQTGFPETLEGNAAINLTLNGKLAFQNLLERSAPPAVPSFGSVEEWEQDAQPLVDYIGHWMDTLSGKLGVDAELQANLGGVNIADKDQHINDLEVKSKFTTNKDFTDLELLWQAKEIGGNASLKRPKGEIYAKIEKSELQFQHSLTIETLDHAELEEPLKHFFMDQDAAYRFGKDLNVKHVLFKTKDEELFAKFNGLIHHPIRMLASGALLQEKLPGVTARLQSQFKIHPKRQGRILPGTPLWSGGLELTSTITVNDGALSFHGEMACDQLSLKGDDFTLSGLVGKVPVNALVESYNTKNNMSISHNLPFAGGALYLKTHASAGTEQTQRIVYYEDLRPYRSQVGLKVGHLKFGDYELDNIQLDAHIENGTLRADHFSTELLGGDVIGNLTLDLNAERELSGILGVQASNIDASHFSKLNLEPGPDSEMSADMRFGFFASATRRDINLDVHVTQIGKKTLDRFLLLLDPEAKDPQIQKTRSNLKIIKIHEVAAWIRHENLNMDLDYSTLLTIPGTNIGFRPIKRELLRRYTLTEQVIDPYFQSYVDRYLAKSLGWTHETP